MRFDVAILGSGFAGSLCALILHRLGRSCVVIDRAAHPRFAVGESSTPTGNLILPDLAARYDLPFLAPLATFGTWREAYPDMDVGKKRGFSYFQHQPGRPFATDALHENELLVAASLDPTYCDTHWLRRDIDQFLVDQVRALGIPVWEYTTISHLASGSTWELKGQQDNQSIQFSADFIIDGTGMSGVLPKALNLPDATDALVTSSRALFSHFDGTQPWPALLSSLDIPTSEYPYQSDDAALHHVLNGAWMWQLRFHSGLLSAGLVLDNRRHPLEVHVSPVQEWDHWLAQYPSLATQFAEAKICADPGRLIRTNRLQRLWGQTAGPNWALLPHTAGFIDPLHSTGLAHSLCGIERLMGILEVSWGKADLGEKLAEHQTLTLQELRLIDLMVAGCYPGMGSIDRLMPMTMLYFAAAITYEEQRMAGRPPKAFLCADDEKLLNLAKQAYSWSVAPPQEPLSEKMEALLRPFNRVGLFNPPYPNMYFYTAIDG